MTPDLGHAVSARPAARIARRAGRIITGIIATAVGCLRSPGTEDEIAAVRRTWPEYRCTWSHGRWTARRRDGTGIPVTARTADALGAAISEDWAAWGAQ
jgi:hypothetical protein